MAVTTEDQLREDVAAFQHNFDLIVKQIETVVRGKTDVIKLAATCMLAGGHLLIEDVPGVGKTTLARALAETIDGSLQRIQFTPDLLPTDVTGVQIYNRGTNEFEFHEGAVFANVVVADEINRASPKTQAALLEVMEEHQVTVDGSPRSVPDPFLVVATQNPIELDGTYDLPEAQLDRFLMRLVVGYPGKDAEMDIVGGQHKSWQRSELQPVLDTGRFRGMSAIADRVHFGPFVKEYLIDLAAATRHRPDVRLGVSPRGAIALADASRAWAASRGRHFVTPDDVKQLAPYVFPHRVIVAPEYELRGTTGVDIVEDVLANTALDDTTRG